MTRLTRAVRRLTVGALSGQFGPDANRRMVVSIVPGDGRELPDMIHIKPMGRFAKLATERISIMDAYRIAMRNRVNLEVLTKARTTKAAKALKRESRRIKAQERKLFSNGEVR